MHSSLLILKLKKLPPTNCRRASSENTNDDRRVSFFEAFDRMHIPLRQLSFNQINIKKLDKNNVLTIKIEIRFDKKINQ